MIAKDVFAAKFNFICQDLKGMEINKVHHSIGSMVQFGFGEDFLESGGKFGPRRSRIAWIYNSQ